MIFRGRCIGHGAGVSGTRAEGQGCRSGFGRLPGSQDHDHLATLHAGLVFNLCDGFEVDLDLLKQLHAELGVGKFTSPETQGHLNLVTFFEEAVHGSGLHLIVVGVDIRPKLDFLDLDDLLALASLVLLFLFLEFELPIIQDLADGRIGIGNDFHKVQTGFRVVAVGVAVWMWREKLRGDVLALSLVLGGALGNIVDRVRYGYVVDYADLHFGAFRPFYIFNLADACISIGVLILLARAFLISDKQTGDGTDVQQPESSADIVEKS